MTAATVLQSSIEKISGEMPHPAGSISVSYDNSGPKMKAEIVLPEKISGTFLWEGQMIKLNGGLNKLEI